MKNNTKKKKQFDVSFYYDWCKSCGICMAFCPQKNHQARQKRKTGDP
ncbi:4Fe-4S binding protein [Desulfobulbus sp. US1]|nr:4Fe-4S binding protein [Desulfobulbus sp. US1]